MIDETSRWTDLASHPTLAVVLDLDETLWPGGSSSEPLDRPLDRGFALLLEALHGVGVHVVFLSRRAIEELAGRVREHAPHAEWVAKTRPTRDLVVRLRERRTGVRVIAIGDGTDDTLFEGLDPDDRALAVRLGEGRRPSAVRAMLWWLVETRRGTSHVLS